MRSSRAGWPVPGAAPADNYEAQQALSFQPGLSDVSMALAHRAPGRLDLGLFYIFRHRLCSLVEHDECVCHAKFEAYEEVLEYQHV